MFYDIILYKGDDDMKEKVAIVVVSVLFAFQWVLLLYLNIKHNFYYGAYTYQFQYYFREIIFYAVLNDALIFTIGILIYYKKLILKSRITSICAGLLSLSIILVVVSGIYYGFTIETSLVKESINSFMNIFYVVYMLCFTVFVLIIFKVKLFSDRLPKTLLLILFTIMIFVYFRQSTYFGYGLNFWTYESISIRQGISYMLLYPATIAAFIVSTLILVKNRDESASVED